MTIRRELLDELLNDYENPQDILGEGGLLKELTKAVIERCLGTELDMHLGYPKHGRKGNANGNTRNGVSQKTLKGEQGHSDIDLPRDRHGTFEPHLVVCLAMRTIAKKWTMPIRNWKPALNRFAVEFAERFPT
jgi:putative transposase